MKSNLFSNFCLKLENII